MSRFGWANARDKWTVVAACLIGWCVAAVSADENVPWESLFDGKTLDGWVQRGGKAKYTVEDGAIVGTTTPATPNSFLCTRRHFGDFELELEYLVDPRLNSGIQIRSNSFPEYKNCRVHGYQVEIDPSDRAWSSGIYDEGRRGWLYPLKDNEVARKAFKQNEWNKVRVLAVGDSIKTWLNGVPAADLIDSMTQTGFIGLQVHSSHEKEPLHVRWRNIRIRDLGRHVWKPLFDKRVLGDDAADKRKWTVRDGVFYLLTPRSFDDFTARFKCRIESGTGGLAFGGGDDPLHSEQAMFVKVGSVDETGGLWSGNGKRLIAGPEQAESQPKPDEWREVTVSVHGRRVVTHVNGQRKVDFQAESDIAAGRLALVCRGTTAVMRFKDVEYLTPAASFLGLKPPRGAIVLLGESDKLDEWRRDGPGEEKPSWLFEDGVLTVKPGAGGLITRRDFGDMYLHLEFNVNDNADGDWQGNGNSGVYIQRRYEVQILNSFGREMNNRDCGAIYGFKAPDAPACKPAGQWQSYDIVFRSPRWSASGEKTENARITVYHNDARIHDNVEVPNKTGHGRPEGPDDAPLLLQDHGNPVRFRNIWIEPLDLSADAQTDLPSR